MCSMKWDSPLCWSLSSRAPTLTHTPMELERTWGIVLETILIPLGRVVLLITGVLFLFQGRLETEPDAAVLGDFQHLDPHDVALFDHIGDLLDAVVGQLGDVHQAVGTRGQ